jgi:uncharacterized protein (UPF0333 family)
VPGTQPPRDRGQASVEFALALPLVVLVVLGVVQLVVVVRDQLADGARAASVAAAPAAAANAAAHRAITLRPLAVTTASGASSVTVTVRATSDTDVPLIGAVMPDVAVSATVTMARDPP